MSTKVLRYKWKGPRWRGQTTLTSSGNLDRRMRYVANGYISQDGQEIRRIPGWRCVVDLGDAYSATRLPSTTNKWRTLFTDSYRTTNPVGQERHEVFVDIERPQCFAQVRNRVLIVGDCDHRRQQLKDSAGTNELLVGRWDNVGSNYLSMTVGGTPTAPASRDKPWGVGVDDYIYVEGTGNAELDGRFHLVVAIGPTTIGINTSLSTSGDAAAGARAYRVRPSGSTDGSSIKSRDDPDNLAIWTLTSPPNVTTPVSTTLVAMMAARTRDYGEVGTDYFIEGVQGTTRRKSINVSYRVNPDVAGDRLLLAAPGYGVVLQAPVIQAPGAGWLPGLDLTNDIYDQIRSVGIPKAVVFDPAVKSTATGLLPADANLNLPNGTYTIQVAYMDDGTGEIGLPSEPVEYTTSSQYIRLLVMHPGYYNPDCKATTILVYMSDTDGQVPALFMQYPIAKYGQQNIVGGGRYIGSLNLYQDMFIIVDVYVNQVSWGRNFVTSDLNFNRVPDPLKQMPMGAKLARTIRGTTFYGGYVGNTGEDLSIQKGLASALFTLPDTTADRNGRDPKEFLQKVMLETDGSLIDGRFGTGAGTIPSAYQGQLIHNYADLFQGDIRTVRLDRLGNCYSKWQGSFYDSPYFYWQRWSVTERVVLPTYNQSSHSKGSVPLGIILPRGLFQWSEADNPGVVPSVNTGFVDAEKTEDLEGIGRYRNMAVMCTRDQTHILAWGRSPSGSLPQLVSSVFGCIAPNSMVEFDHGSAWISDRGPCALMGGTVLWIGQDFERDFLGVSARYVRDSRGLMPHAWAAHDRQRKLVYFGLRNTNDTFQLPWQDGSSYPYSTASDQCRSKFPCNEVLVWSYESNAWSVWYPPAGLQVYWMAELTCSDSKDRMCFMAEDGRIYAMDDAWHDGSTDGGQTTADADATSSATFVSASSAFNVAFPFTDDSYSRNGMEYMIYDPTTYKVKGWGTIVSVDTTTQVTLSRTHSWSAGDIFVWGFQTMRVSTLRENYGNATSEHAVQAVDLRYSIYSTTIASGQGSPSHESRAFADVWVQNESGSWPFQRSTPEKDETLDLGGFDSATGASLDRTFQYRTETGRPRGFNSSVSVWFRGLGQVRLQDLETELAGI